MRNTIDLLGKIWTDIRDVENYDLYLGLLAATIVILLDLLSVPMQGAMDSVTLAILALVTVGLLGNRWRLEQLQQATGARHPTLLDQDAGVDGLFREAREIWLLGISRSTTIARQFPVLEEMLRRGGKIRVLIIDPLGNGPMLAGDRHYVPTDEDRCRAIIRRALSDLSCLRQFGTQADSLEVKTLDFVPSFGLTLFDPDTQHGAIQVILYNHAVETTPIVPQLLLSPHDHPWYRFYRKQMDTLWQRAAEYSWTIVMD